MQTVYVRVKYPNMPDSIYSALAPDSANPAFYIRKYQNEYNRRYGSDTGVSYSLATREEYFAHRLELRQLRGVQRSTR